MIRRSVDDDDLPFEVERALEDLHTNEELTPIHTSHLKGGILNTEEDATRVAIVPTRREPMPGEQVGAKAVKLGEIKLRPHGFLDGNDVYVFVADVLN